MLNAISLPSGDQIGSRLTPPFDVKRVGTSRSSAISQISGGLTGSADRKSATWRPSGASDGRFPGSRSPTFLISLPDRSNQISGRAPYDARDDERTRYTSVLVADTVSDGAHPVVGCAASGYGRPLKTRRSACKS